MSDIVERLRLLVPSDPSGASIDAINEIESLRQKTQYWPNNAERDAVIRHQKEEIERLRAALEELLACPHVADRDIDPAWIEPETEAAVEAARAALEGKNE